MIELLKPKSSTADVIDLAINEFLYEGSGVRGKRRRTVRLAVFKAYEYNIRKERNVVDAPEFVEWLLGDMQYLTCYEFPDGPQRQFARAMALTFAALIARESATSD